MRSLAVNVLGIAFAGILLPVVLAEPAHAATNLFANASAETAANSSTPQSWSKGSWGSLTASFSYPTGTGHSGSRYVKVQLTKWSSGDAKWFPSTVSVSPSTTYDYSVWYQANVATELVAVLNDSSGNSTYVSFGTPASSSTAWAQATGSFKTLSNTKTATVFHLIKKVGWVQDDDVSLSTGGGVVPPPDPVPVPDPIPDPNPNPNPTPDPLPQPQNNLIVNPGMETAGSSDTSIPSSWSKDSWGSNAAKFTCPTGGAHGGARSGRIDVTAWSDGDLKWSYNSIKVTSGGYYEFRDWYKSNVATRAIAEVANKDGSIDYYSLEVAMPSSDWKQYATKFRVSSSASSVTVWHVISSVGWLQTDDYVFSPTSVGGFNRGLVTLTFDDGWQSIYSNAKPLLDARGLKTTQFIVSGFVNSGGYMTTNQVQSWINGGHEIGAHTVSHPDLTTVSSNQLNTEVNQVKSYLSNTFGVNAVSFATPYGAYDQVVLPVIKAAYQQHRSVDVGVNAKDDFDKWNLKVCNVDNTTTQAQFNEWLTMATQNKLWVIFVYHGVDGSGETYNVTPAALTGHLDAVVNSGVTVLPLKDAMAEVLGQGAVTFP